MTTLTLGKVKLVNRGTWSSTATYTQGDIVQYNGISFVYKNETPKGYTALFHGPLSSLPKSGTITSLGARASSFTVSWSSALPTTATNVFVPNSNLWVYSKYIEPNSKLIAITHNSTTSSTITIDRTSTNISAVSNVPVDVGTRRRANMYETSLNTVDWDQLSDGMQFAGEWSTSTAYLPGQIVTKNDNSYMCMQGHTNVNPLFDYAGVWEPFLVGDDGLPHQRIVTPMQGNPHNWRSHPYIPAPNWGSGAYTGIPWNLSTDIKTHPWAPIWNRPEGGSYMNYRGAISDGADGRGNALSHGYGYYGSQPGQSDTYRAFIGENGAQHEYGFYTDKDPHYGNASFRENFSKGNAPRIMQQLRQWTTMACLTSSGTVLTSGTNSSSALGIGEATDFTSSFNELGKDRFAGRSIVKISGSPGNSRNSSVWWMVLDEYGEVWTWGYNGYGQIGIGPENHLSTGMRRAGQTNSVSSPMCLEKDIFFEGQRIVDIFGLENSAYALTEGGDLFSWGRNNYGQLGYSTAGFISTSQSAAPYKIPVNWGTYGGIQKVCTPSTENEEWLMVLDGQGHVWTVGYNNVGQLGTNNTTNDGTTSTIRRTSQTAGWSIGGGIKNIWGTTGGFNLSWFLDSSHQLWACGSGSHYVFGNSSTSNRLVPAQMFGPNGAMTNIVKVISSGRSGGTSIVVLDKDGITYGTGWNGYGEAGIGHASNASNQSYTQSDITSSTSAGFTRCLLPSNMYETGNKVVNIWGYGDYDATTSHITLTSWLTERGELLAAGRDYNYSMNQNGYFCAPVKISNLE